jgi:hypothetical protein
MARPIARSGAFALAEDRSMVAVTDEALTKLLQVADMIDPADRSQFVRVVAAELRRHETIGDSLISHVIEEVQRRYFLPVDPVHAADDTSRG